MRFSWLAPYGITFEDPSKKMDIHRKWIYEADAQLEFMV